MLYILRAIFLIISGIIGWYIGSLFSTGPADHATGYYGLIIGMVLAVLFVTGEVFFTRRYIGTISVVMFGLVFGFIVSFLFIQALFLLPWMQKLVTDTPNFKEWLSFAITFAVSFLSILAIIRSKDDFKFVIPFIELSKEGKGMSPIIVDTSVIIDGRIADIGETGIIEAPLIIPRFVLMELQRIADSADRLKRTRGRHGLDILKKMQDSKNIDVQISEVEMPNIKNTDDKLIELAKHLKGRLMTTDFNLNKVAQVQGITVINMNDMTNALKTVVLPGETMEVRIVRQGEEYQQGVAYLNDGTMIVVEGAGNKIGQRLTVTTTSVLQTSAGKMIFANVGGSQRGS
ncbi:MAG: PIN/TRAM domain-containing protein [Planctomycetes bacterium]|nr:PIN/TRAM domain-containing protein [Planctomycetota bacterium]